MWHLIGKQVLKAEFLSIAIGIVGGAGLHHRPNCKRRLLVQDQSGNEVWTGFNIRPRRHTSRLFGHHKLSWYRRLDNHVFGVGRKNRLRLYPEISLFGYDWKPLVISGSTEYFLNRNATPWDAIIADLDISPSGGGMNDFTFNITAITAIPAGAILLVAAGQPLTITD